ncbi:glycosyltransferase family 4 protein [Piromyces sp. E2]|nr:glycosyltransferase family 4 protein [Piromyces sp. E2]|eukprot:OUM70390.1 glycosyltransferase family 4 protein [Piromyces sp. E2]
MKFYKTLLFLIIILIPVFAKKIKGKKSNSIKKIKKKHLTDAILGNICMTSAQNEILAKNNINNTKYIYENDQCPKLIVIYVSHLGYSGLGRVASMLSFILRDLNYQVVFIMENVNLVTYNYYGLICKCNMKSKFVKNLLNEAAFIFDFHWKYSNRKYPFVKYCIDHYENKYIPTIHTETCKPYFDVIKKYLDKKPISHLYRILCVSEAVRKNFINIYGDNNNILTIHNPIDIKKIEMSLAAGTDFELEGYYLYAGRLGTPHSKGLDLLLRGFLQSKASENNYLVIAGAGKLNNILLDELESNPRKDRIIFLGFRSDIYALMAKAKCLLAPSRREGFSMSHIESLACGTPVVSSRCGGAEEIIQHKKNGYLFDVEDLEGFIDAINYMDTNAKSMRNTCIKSVQKFSTEKYMKKIGKILSESN